MLESLLYTPIPPESLFAWCMGRNGMQVFIFTQIIVAYAPDTGDIIDDPARHFWDLRNEDPRLKLKGSANGRKPRCEL